MATIETEKEFLELLPILAQNNADLGELNKQVKEDVLEPFETTQL